MKSQYIIIITTTITLIATMLFLAYTEQHQRDTQQHFWSIYFISPNTDTNDFIIENNADETLFIYKIHSGDTELHAGEITLAKNAWKRIKTQKTTNIRPITVTVTNGDTEKIIEKK